MWSRNETLKGRLRFCPLSINTDYSSRDTHTYRTTITVHLLPATSNFIIQSPIRINPLQFEGEHYEYCNAK